MVTTGLMLRLLLLFMALIQSMETTKSVSFSDVDSRADDDDDDSGETWKPVIKLIPSNVIVKRMYEELGPYGSGSCDQLKAALEMALEEISVMKSEDDDACYKLNLDFDLSEFLKNLENFESLQHDLIKKQSSSSKLLEARSLRRRSSRSFSLGSEDRKISKKAPAIVLPNAVQDIAADDTTSSSSSTSSSRKESKEKPKVRRVSMPPSTGSPISRTLKRNSPRHGKGEEQGRVRISPREGKIDGKGEDLSRARISPREGNVEEQSKNRISPREGKEKRTSPRKISPRSLQLSPKESISSSSRKSSSSDEEGGTEGFGKYAKRLWNGLRQGNDSESKKVCKDESEDPRISYDEPTNTFLLRALIYQSADHVKLLFRAGAEMHPYAIHLVCRMISFQALEKLMVLLENGAFPYVNGEDDDGLTPLHYLFFRLPEKPDLVYKLLFILLKHGASPDVVDMNLVPAMLLLMKQINSCPRTVDILRLMVTKFDPNVEYGGRSVWSYIDELDEPCRSKAISLLKRHHTRK